MSRIDRSITPTDVIPVVETEIFAHEQENSRFAVGILAVGDVALAGFEAEYEGYYQLRRKVYVDQTGQLDIEDINPDGRDTDSDDARSVAFGVVENIGEEGKGRVVGALRLIIKGFDGGDGMPADHSPLPIEKEWPEIFPEPAPDKALEVSRLIARHEKSGTQAVIRQLLYKAGLSYIMTHDLGPTYAIVEEWFSRAMASDVPKEAIGDPKYVEKYNDFNIPLEIDTDAMAASIEARHPGAIATMRAAEKDMVYIGNRVPQARPAVA